LSFVRNSLGFASEAGPFGGRVTGACGTGPVVVYGTEDLVTWQPVFTNEPVIGAFDFVDSQPGLSPGRFYRAAELPGLEDIRLRISNEDPVGITVVGLGAGGPVTIYASTNLTDWEPVFTNPPTIGPLHFLESPAPRQSYRFYRASEIRPTTGQAP
jgi:hypothetical protein